MATDDRKASYFRRRSEAEQRAAEAASVECARAAHRELASLYRARAESFAAGIAVPA